MVKDILRRVLIIIGIILIIFGHILYYFDNFKLFRVRSYRSVRDHSFIITTKNQGWISSLLYTHSRAYIQLQQNTIGKIGKRIDVERSDATTLPLDYDYIQNIEDDRPLSYPYSGWECSNTSVADVQSAREYCILTNIYYDSNLDRYYFYENRTINQRISFNTPFGGVNISIISNVTFLRTPMSVILKRPVLVSIPPYLDYTSGFLETCGPRFWSLAECQYHASYVNPKTIQLYYTSEMFKVHPFYWNHYQQQSDGTYRPLRLWEQLMNSMFSIYPLLICTSFNNRTVMFKHMIFPGRQSPRSAVWGHHYLERKFHSYPLPTLHYRRAYLAYSEWILYHFNLLSKFQLTSSQQELQKKRQIEQIPMCLASCSRKRQTTPSDDYTGEWIVVLNRRGHNNSEIYNANELVQALLTAFPDHSNTQLRVWPEVFYVDDNFYQTIRMFRSIRVLIGVHGVDLSNSIFMRPGAVLFEIDPYGCRDLSFIFRRWAEVFNLQYALWIPSTGNNNRQDEVCLHESQIEVNAKEIIDELKNSLRNEIDYRNGYFKRALDILNDLSIVDRPPSGYEDILS
ncbi:unnamed protein product [Adineta ricciae]|uniref:Glycosyltransferase 61 catalytic domain-containing protein n=1 Tax=Adineta ricciae TaxID=249248 RepID=A0A813X9G8_ADIRI|nr:unnamed protein product [Adineta ricciae]